MHVEAFSEGKDLDTPDANEDQLLVLPGRGFAVIDGVTDRTGHRYDGMLAGRIAGLTVQRSVAELLLDPDAARLSVAEIVDRLSAAICAAYERHGILELARAERPRRFGATLALAIDAGEIFRFVLIGDSGLRLDGSELWLNDTGLDLVTSSLRQEAYRLAASAGCSGAELARVGRALAFHGATALHDDLRPWIGEAEIHAIRRVALERCRLRLPHVPEADLARLLDGGVIRGQGHFQNNTSSPLSYAVLDGFEVPTALVRVIERPKGDLATIELFTDGYFAPATEPTVASWEASFAEVERVDPLKIERYPSVKGTIGRVRADDRTVVIVRP